MQSTTKKCVWAVKFLLLFVFLTSNLLAQDLIVRGGFYFDTEGESFIPVKAIVIKNGRFMQINHEEPGPEYIGFREINLEGNTFILPGIIDVHSHYNVNLNKIRRDEILVNPVLNLANGVTSTWPAGEYNPEQMLEARRRIDRGEQIGARIFNSGPYFGQGWEHDAPVEEIYKAVDHWIEMGALNLKAKRINAVHLQALLERAHQHGVRVSAHLDSGYRNTVNTRDAILMGLDRVEHFFGGGTTPLHQSAYASIRHLSPDSPELIEIMKLYLKHKVFFTATLTAYGYYGDRKQGYDYWTDEKRFLTPFMREFTKDRRQEMEMFNDIYYVKQKTIKKFYNMGGIDLIALGTDHPTVGEFFLGFAAHRELDAFVLAGIPEAKALKIATINGARALGISDDFGSIETGKMADMFMIKGNPLENIRNTRTVYMVIKGGKVYHTQELLNSVEDRLGPKNAEELVNW